MKSFWFLLRREIWEHRALWLVPASISGMIVIVALAIISVAEVRRGFESTGTIIELKEIEEHKTAIQAGQARIEALQRKLEIEVRRLDGQAREREPGRREVELRIERAVRLIEKKLETLDERIGAVLSDGADPSQASVELGRYALRIAQKALEAELASSSGDPEAARRAQEELARLDKAIEQEAVEFSRKALQVAEQALKDREISPGVPGDGDPQARIAVLEKEIEREARRIKGHALAIAGVSVQRSGADDDIRIELIELSKLNLGYLVEAYARLGSAHHVEFLRGGLMVTALVFFGFTMIVIIFYSLDALYAERKEKTALFWKSMPVSDTQTVLSKLVTALVVAPLITLAAVVITHLVLLLIGSGLVAWYGQNPWSLVWAPAALGSGWLQALGVYVLQVLWFLPLVAWLLLVSAWVQRSPFLHAILIPAVLILLEGWLLRSRYLLSTIEARLSFQVDAGDMTVRINTIGDHLHTVTPDKFLATFVEPAMWWGLIVGALFLAAAVWARRYRDEY